MWYGNFFLSMEKNHTMERFFVRNILIRRERQWRGKGNLGKSRVNKEEVKERQEVVWKENSNLSKGSLSSQEEEVIWRTVSVLKKSHLEETQSITNIPYGTFLRKGRRNPKLEEQRLNKEERWRRPSSPIKKRNLLTKY